MAVIRRLKRVGGGEVGRASHAGYVGIAGAVDGDACALVLAAAP